MGKDTQRDSVAVCIGVKVSLNGGTLRNGISKFSIGTLGSFSRLDHWLGPGSPECIETVR